MKTYLHNCFIMFISPVQMLRCFPVNWARCFLAGISRSVMLPLSFAEYFELVGEEKRDAWNSYPKFIISMDELPMDEDGIKQVNIIDFLLSA